MLHLFEWRQVHMWSACLQLGSRLCILTAPHGIVQGVEPLHSNRGTC